MTTKYPEMQQFVFFSLFDHVIHIEGTVSLRLHHQICTVIPLEGRKYSHKVSSRNLYVLTLQNQLFLN